MKSFKLSMILALIVLSGIVVYGQINPSSPDYQSMKEQGLIEQPQQVTPAEPVNTITPTETGGRDLSLFVPRDGTFTGPQGNGCDDCSYGPFTLPFTFCFYGTDYTSFYINNNGNVSFEGSYWEFSPSGFPVSGFGMLAPFWADVVTWDDVCGLEIGD